MALIIYFICFAINIPGMINGNWLSFLAGGFCLGILVSEMMEER